MTKSQIQRIHFDIGIYPPRVDELSLRVEARALFDIGHWKFVINHK
jgi:hypothetical protein